MPHQATLMWPSHPSHAWVHPSFHPPQQIASIRVFAFLLLGLDSGLSSSRDSHSIIVISPHGLTSKTWRT
ncbi:hypothetical protein LIA77_10710 [Sarocladium implicatum]|nr:hypothetical protein LIA77_10710 [Sarocladium implicatum]